MKPPSLLPQLWTSLPAPVVFGVLASLVPLSVPVMAGLMTTTMVFAGLSIAAASEETSQTAIPIRAAA
jgi:hypothetical protein